MTYTEELDGLYKSIVVPYTRYKQICTKLSVVTIPSPTTVPSQYWEMVAGIGPVPNQ